MSDVFRLTKSQKSKVMKAARDECANLLTNDWGDPFKDREVPYFSEELAHAADDYFFECVKAIAEEVSSGALASLRQKNVLR